MKAARPGKNFLRMIAVFLSLIMLTSVPIQAFAAQGSEDFEIMSEEGSDDSYEDTFEDSYEDDTVSFDDDENIEIITESSDEDAISDEAIEAMLESVNSEITIEDANSEKDSELPENLRSASDEDELTDEEAEQQALEILKSNGIVHPFKNLAKIIPEDCYTVTRFSDYVKVENKAEGTDLKDYLYVALINNSEEAEAGNLFMLGTSIAPGEAVELSFYYDGSKNKKLLDKDSSYILWLGRGDTYTEDGSEDIKYYEFKFLGYTPEYDTENEKVIYVRAEMDEINVPKFEGEDGHQEGAPDPGVWTDGFSEIKMKSVIQKIGPQKQPDDTYKPVATVTVSWPLDKKNKEWQKAYKKYDLLHLVPDSSEPTGYREEPLLKKLTTNKTVTIKNVNYKEDSMLYLLKCYDKSETLLAQYVTTTAPYFLQIQSGETTGEFDFTMIQRPDDASFYQLQIAAKNKEYDETKAPTGFQEAWSTLYQVESGFNEGNSIGEFYIGAKTRPEAILLRYNIGSPIATLGTTYYGRIRTVTYINDLKVTSAPSNVLSCKAGPAKCYVLTSACVYFDKNNANKGGNAANIDRASQHIVDYFNDYSEDEEGIPSQSDIYVHNTNKEVCYRDGLIYFIVDKTDIPQIKSFQLLTCNYSNGKPNGKFTKVKTYTLKNTALMECNTSGIDYLGNFKVFAMYFNGFTPEKEIAYAVRAVGNRNSAAGGFGGVEVIKPKMDAVQGLYTADAGINKIVLSWLADDCVKQYWVYRSPKSRSYEERFDAVRNEKPIAKVDITAAKKYTYNLSDDTYDQKSVKYMTYTDRKNLVVDTYYYYFVLPVYKTSGYAKNVELFENTYIPNSSDEVKGKASALYSQITGFKAANEATKKIKVSFNQVKNITHYRIFRLKVNSSVKKLTDAMKPDLTELYKEAGSQYDNISDFEDYLSGQPLSRWIEIMSGAGYGGNTWEFIDTISTSGKGTAAKSFIDDENVEVGSYYFYLIQGATEKSSSVNFSYTSRVQNKPLAVTDASITYGNPGIKLSYKLNSKDRQYQDWLVVEVSRDGGKWTKKNNNGYTDTNMSRGVEHSYKIRVRYGDSDYTSGEVTLKYSLPSGIDVNMYKDSNTYNNNTFYLKVGETAKISYRAYLNDGSTASYSKVERTETPEENDTIIITEKGTNYFSFKANQKGSVSYWLTCAGVSKQITIIVN